MAEKPKTQVVDRPATAIPANGHSSSSASALSLGVNGFAESAMFEFLAQMKLPNKSVKRKPDLLVVRHDNRNPLHHDDSSYLNELVEDPIYNQFVIPNYQLLKSYAEEEHRRADEAAQRAEAAEQLLARYAE